MIVQPKALECYWLAVHVHVMGGDNGRYCSVKSPIGAKQGREILNNIGREVS